MCSVPAFCTPTEIPMVETATTICAFDPVEVACVETIERVKPPRRVGRRMAAIPQIKRFSSFSAFRRK